MRSFVFCLLHLAAGSSEYLGFGAYPHCGSFHPKSFAFEQLQTSRDNLQRVLSERLAEESRNRIKAKILSEWIEDFQEIIPLVNSDDPNLEAVKHAIKVWDPVRDPHGHSLQRNGLVFRTACQRVLGEIKFRLSHSFQPFGTATAIAIFEKSQAMEALRAELIEVYSACLQELVEMKIGTFFNPPSNGSIDSELDRVQGILELLQQQRVLKRPHNQL